MQQPKFLNLLRNFFISNYTTKDGMVIVRNLIQNETSEYTKTISKRGSEHPIKLN